MEYDSFSEGVELGGLRTKNEIKILIGYLLSRLDTPLKREQLDEIICGEELANYFEMSQALSELADSGNVKIRDNELSITEKGKKNSETLEHDIPLPSEKKHSIRRCGFRQGFAVSVRIKFRSTGWKRAVTSQFPLSMPMMR